MKAHRSDMESFVEVTSSKQWSKSGLKPWSLYNITISAITVVGEGVQSAILRVRTDEEGKKRFVMSGKDKYQYNFIYLNNIMILFGVF